MRKVKIISSGSLGKLAPLTSDYEDAINKAFNEIEDNGGKIIKTEYGISRQGTVGSVSIEYETDKTKFN